MWTTETSQQELSERSFMKYFSNAYPKSPRKGVEMVLANPTIILCAGDNKRRRQMLGTLCTCESDYPARVFVFAWR